MSHCPHSLTSHRASCSFKCLDSLPSCCRISPSLFESDLLLCQGNAGGPQRGSPDVLPSPACVSAPLPQAKLHSTGLSDLPAGTLASGSQGGGHVMGPAAAAVCGWQHQHHLPKTNSGLSQKGKSTSEGGAVTTLELPVAFQERGRNFWLRMRCPAPPEASAARTAAADKCPAPVGSHGHFSTPKVATEIA